MTGPRHGPERLLLPVRTCLALVLLTPLAWAPWTLYPFPVGKAVWARTCIAAAFALWTVLALLRPCWRPPRSALLAALLAGLAAAVLSACFGVSPQHSLWSTYTRMQGTVNAAHWISFAVVVASVMHTSADWTRLLNLNLVVGLAVSLLAIMRFAAPETPLPLPGIGGHWPRIGASAGNPILLGAYLQATALLAAGFLVRSFCGETAPAARPALTRAERRRAMHRQGKAEARAPREGGWGGRLFWTAAAGCALAGVALTGSLGALAGLAAGAGAASALYALYGRARRSRRLGLAGLGAVGAVTVVLALALRGPAPAPAFHNPMLERATSAGEVGLTLGNRLRNWEAGMKAFAERPLLGWGSDNYFVASARHLTAPEGRAKVRDHAHNLFVEEAASRGVAGLAAWLALWGLTALVVLRAARRLEDPRERALAAFAGAALAGWFVQGLTSFYSAGSWLQHMLLLGFLVHFESRVRGQQPAALDRLLALGVDVLVIEFEALVGEPGRVLDAMARLCAAPPFGRVDAAPVNRAEAARFPPLAAAAKLTAVALRALGARRLLQALKDNPRLVRLVFRPARHEEAPALGDTAAACLDRRHAACRAAVEAACERLDDGLWLARGASGCR